MKKFKNFFLAAVAVAMFGLTSCNNDDVINPIVPEEGAASLAIRLGGVVSVRSAGETGVIEGQASNAGGTIQLDHAQIFVLNSANEVVHTQGISTTTTTILTDDGTSAGDNLLVQLTDRIFVVGNTPAGYLADLEDLDTLAEILAFTSAIATQDDYAYVVLANVNGTAIVVNTGSVYAGTIPGNNPGDELRELTININPVISRLELHNVNAFADYRVNEMLVRTYEPCGILYDEDFVDIYARVAGFTVTGVFVDNTFEYFTYGGAGTDLRFLGVNNNAGLMANLSEVYHIEGTWAAETGIVANQLVARAAAPVSGVPQVWAFNVASSNVPHLIVRFENITWAPRADYDWRGADRYDVNSDLVYFEIPGPVFITVTGYTGVTTFQRGNIYRVSGFDLEVSDLVILEDIINPEGVNVRVGVQVQEWNWVNTSPTW